MVQVQEAEDCGAGGNVLVVAGENKNVNGKYECFVISNIVCLVISDEVKTKFVGNRLCYLLFRGIKKTLNQATNVTNSS